MAVATAKRPAGRPQVSHAKKASLALAAYNRQKTKSEKERFEKLKLENAIMRAEYLKRSELAKRLATVADAMSSRIMGDANLSRGLKEELLKDLASIPLIFEEVAHAQSRFVEKKAAQETDGEKDETEA